MGQTLIDEIGNRYGALVVQYLTKDKNNRTAWLCQCDCGNTKIVRGPDLRKNKITHCSAKCPLKHSNLIDETGNIYGRLTVLYRSEKNINKKVYWYCRCICGNECDVTSQSLRSGKTQSCGCLANELTGERRTKDLSNQKFGKLTAISKIDKKDNHGNWIWYCKCDCGKFCEVTSVSLISGNTQSCGCLRSIKELEITNFLQKNNINFQPQYSFLDLVSKNNRVLRFDFAIFNHKNKLIFLLEYNGDQHYKNTFQIPEQKFLEAQQRDLMKLDYCINHNIPLLILNKENYNLDLILLKYKELNNYE